MARIFGSPLVDRCSTNRDTPAAPSHDDHLARDLGPDFASQLWLHDESQFKAGMTHDHLDVWDRAILPEGRLTSLRQAVHRDTIMAWLRDGIDAERFMFPYEGAFQRKWYKARVPPPFSAENHPVETPELMSFVSREIANLVQCGAVSSSRSIPRCVLPLGVEPNKPRLILDARFVNLWCEPPEMTYDTLREFQRGVRPNDWMFSLDFKSGYHHIKLKESSRKYFGFQWEGVYYTFNVLPFGWNVTPYVFNTLSTILVAFLRERGHHSLVYLDDFGFGLPALMPEGQRAIEVWKVVALMYLVGYTISFKKSNLVPSQSMILLGFGLDSIRQRFFIPERKLKSFLALLDQAVPGGQIPVRTFQSLIGKAESLSIAAPPIRIFLRSSYDALTKALRKGLQKVTLSATVSEDLQQLRALESWDRLSTWHSEQHATFRMETDASLSGWGGTLSFGDEYREVGGVFSKDEDDEPIHVKELLAVKLSLEALSVHVKDCFLDVYTDNVIVQYTLLNGSATDLIMRAYSRTLLEFQLRHNIIIRVFRISTGDNVRADALSRAKYPTHASLDRNDHRLNPLLYAIVQQWSPKSFTLDACASAENTHLPRFISRFPSGNPNCVAVNALSYHFKREHVYVNPPWPLISALWTHFRQVGAVGVMIFPSFPSRGWFGDVLRSAVWVRRLARAGDENVFLQPSRRYQSSVGPVPWDVLVAYFDFSFLCPGVFRV